MFPDVFESSPSCKQTLQMSSFYETRDKVRVQPRLQLKAYQHPQYQHPQYQHQHGPGSVLGLHGISASPGPSSSDIGESDDGGDVQPDGHNTRSILTPLHAIRSPLLPPMRRIVKFSVTPVLATIPISICIALNTSIWFAIPESATPPLVAHWGVFLHLWPLIALMQFVSHSVYLCTPATVWLSVLHLAIVTMTAVIPVHLLPIAWFSRLLFLICITITAHQSIIFCLVYSQLQYRWVYATVASILTVVPITQLAQIEYTDQGATAYSSWLSAVSIYSIYALAIANARGGVIVDMSVAPSPTWLQE